MSKPIVVIVCMVRSSESWEPQQRPHPWHRCAGGGAVHSIKLGSPEVQPGGLLCPRKQTSSDQPVRSGSRRVDIEARAFEEEPCFEDASGQICNRVREAAMWAASLHTLMLPTRRLPPSWGLIPTWR